MRWVLEAAEHAEARYAREKHGRGKKPIHEHSVGFIARGCYQRDFGMTAGPATPLARRQPGPPAAGREGLA